jgi:hypothetical protein
MEKMHKLDGPSYIEYNMYGYVIEERYYIFGVPLTKEDFYTPGVIDAFVLENS